MKTKAFIFIFFLCSLIFISIVTIEPSKDEIQRKYINYSKHNCFSSLIIMVGAIEEFKTKAGIDHRWRPWGGGWVKRGNGKGGAGARKGGQGSDRSSSGGNAGEGGAQSGVMNKTKAEKRKKLELMEEED
ncbi:uncharacterized protein LOC123886218 [Trifolium pratense]|uniref:uncharacterized protein LOC123886218 n=1 Tax=Trifolium pratense TaxID=57577 RepID=UPI001E694487|nr:uncharacterized protein LOC123886218 [Trifolium pratense]